MPDEALPDDPAAIVFPDPYGTFFTLAGVVAEILALESELLTETE